MLPIVEIRVDVVAHLEPVVRRDGHVAGIEQLVDVGSQEQAVPDVVPWLFLERPDVSRLERRELLLARYGALPASRAPDRRSRPEDRASWPVWAPRRRFRLRNPVLLRPEERLGQEDAPYRVFLPWARTVPSKSSRPLPDPHQTGGAVLLAKRLLGQVARKVRVVLVEPAAHDRLVSNRTSARPTKPDAEAPILSSKSAACLPSRKTRTWPRSNPFGVKWHDYPS